MEILDRISLANANIVEYSVHVGRRSLQSCVGSEMYRSCA